MESSAERGTVTDLAAEFAPEAAKMAAERVNHSISAAEVESQRLRGFVSDNANLIALVQKLPEALHHDIMVPFGKAAFFPGRLVHTNEFLVLLGDGYYADATAKQTLEILRRRGNSLESQIGSLDSVVKDLRAEASFFSQTASELSEDGMVEIREDYVEECSTESHFEPEPIGEASSSASEGNNKKAAIDDEEYARIMARFDELEMEELEDEADEESKDENEETKVRCIDSTQCTGLTTQPMRKDGPQSLDNTFASNMNKYDKKFDVPIVVENKIEAFTSSHSQEFTEPRFDGRKAFTGSIVEHADNIRSNLQKHTSQTSGSQPSKPVSRFKKSRE